MLSASSILGRDFDIMAAGASGLVRRQQLHAANLGNVDTAGYRARTLDFETTLRHAIDSGKAQSSPLGADGALLPNATGDALTAGNLVSHFSESRSAGGVDRTSEVSAMMSDGLAYRVLVQQLNNRISSLRNVLAEMGRG